MVTELASGEELGQFVLVKRVGEVGAAEVWQAEELIKSVSKEVDLKIIRPEHVEKPELRATFFEEANLAQKAKHKNLLGVLGAHEVDGYLVQVMEHFDGKDLSSILTTLENNKDVFPPQFALLIAKQIAEALHHVHEMRDEAGKLLEVVHRDINPKSIKLSKTGEVKLLGFDVDRAQVRMGMTKPKAGYMAPEQASEVGVSSASDIFAHGIVLWEMLMLTRLFSGRSDAETMRAIMESKVPSIRDSAPDLPEDAEKLLMNMLERRAVDRPKMDEVVRQLSGALSHFPSGATATEAFEAWLEPLVCPELVESRRVAREMHDTNPIEVPQGFELPTFPVSPMDDDEAQTEVIEVEEDPVPVGSKGREVEVPRIPPRQPLQTEKAIWVIAFGLLSVVAFAVVIAILTK